MRRRLARALWTVADALRSVASRLHPMTSTEKFHELMAEDVAVHRAFYEEQLRAIPRDDWEAYRDATTTTTRPDIGYIYESNT